MKQVLARVNAEIGPCTRPGENLATIQTSDGPDSVFVHACEIETTFPDRNATVSCHVTGTWLPVNSNEVYYEISIHGSRGLTVLHVPSSHVHIVSNGRDQCSHCGRSD